jgi:hypothetical protein
VENALAFAVQNITGLMLPLSVLIIDISAI